MSVGRSVGPTQVSMCSSSDKTVLVYHVTMLQCCSVAVLQCVINALGRSIWKKHLGDVYIVKMIV